MPRLLDLPHGYQTVIDDADLLLVQSLALYRGTNGYVYFSRWHHGKSHPYTLHSLFLGIQRGKHTDHINGDKLDNRRSNLRVVTPSINQANRKQLSRANRSGIRGVSYNSTMSRTKPWRAQIMVNRIQYHIGLFATQEEALQAHKAAELRGFGELCPIVY